MRLNKFFAFALCSLAFAGCQKQNSGMGETGSGALRFSGTTELPAGRTTLANDGLAISWDAGDKVAIFATSASNATAGVNVEYQTTGSGTSSDFAAVGTAITPTAGESTTFYSYYPYASGAADATVIAVSVPQAQNQAGAANEIGKIAFMAATPVVVAAADLSEPISMAYNQIFAIMEIPVAKRTDGKTLASIELSSDATLAANPLWGAGTVDVTQATFPVAGFAAAGNADNKITLTFATALDLTVDQKAWILVNPTNHGANSKLTVKLNFGDASNESYAVKGGDIQRAKRYVLTAPEAPESGYELIPNGLDNPTTFTKDNWAAAEGSGLIKKITGVYGESTSAFDWTSINNDRLAFMAFDGKKPSKTEVMTKYDGSTNTAANWGLLQAGYGAEAATIGLTSNDLNINIEFNAGKAAKVKGIKMYPRANNLINGLAGAGAQVGTGNRLTSFEVYVTDQADVETLVAKFVFTGGDGDVAKYPLAVAPADYAPYTFRFVENPTGDLTADALLKKVEISNPKSARIFFPTKGTQTIPTTWKINGNIELSEVEFWGEPVI